jgi:hypothetical protein
MALAVACGEQWQWAASGVSAVVDALGIYGYGAETCKGA